MTVNYIQEGEVLSLLVSAGAAAGEALMVGTIKGVALETISTTVAGSVATEGVFDVSVQAVNDAGNSAVAIGDPIYFNSGDTPKLNKKIAGYFWGEALEAITSGATDTIKVKLIPGPGPGTADILAGAIGASELATGAVTETKIGSLAVTGAKIAASTVTKDKLAGSFSKVTLAAGGTANAAVTVSGMAVGDELVSVLAFTTAAAIATVAERKTEYTVAAGSLTKANGTDESNNQLVIFWNDLT